MKRYLQLQLKRVLRLVPALVCVAGILFGSIAALYSFVVQMDSLDGSQTKIKVGLVGTAGDLYLELGLAAMGTLDSTRFAMEMVPMEESEAATALAQGQVAAFIVIPPGFMDEAFRGNIMSLKYYGNAGTVGIVSLVKDEITAVINDILAETQKGIYGAGSAMTEQGYYAGQIINDISLEYVELVFERSDVYTVTELGISDGLGLEGYLLCGLAVLFLMLICLPFGTLFIRQEHALVRMLAAKRNAAPSQIFCEFSAFFAGILGLIGVLVAVALLSGVISADTVTAQQVFAILSVIVMAICFSLLLFEVAKDMISGTLLHFFLTLSLCFVSGCMYPVFFFPETVQKLAAWLPTGAARVQLESCLTGNFSWETTALLLVYSGIFAVSTLMIRRYRIRGIRG